LKCHAVPKLSPEVIDILVKNSLLSPIDSLASIIIHITHGKACLPNPDSCFVQRQPHASIEIVGASFEESEKDVMFSWADSVSNDLKDGGLVNEGQYAVFAAPGSQNEAWFGENWEKLKALKKKLDKDNIFQFATASYV
jgi:hypothetical protein